MAVGRDALTVMAEDGMEETITIAELRPEHASAVRAIHAEGLATGLAAFRATPPLWRDWDAGHLAIGRRVALAGPRVVGWGALSPVADT